MGDSAAVCSENASRQVATATRVLGSVRLRWPDRLSGERRMTDPIRGEQACSRTPGQTNSAGPPIIYGFALGGRHNREEDPDRIGSSHPPAPCR